MLLEESILPTVTLLLTVVLLLPNPVYVMVSVAEVPEPDTVTNVKLPAPSVLRTCPLDPSTVGYVIPLNLVVPVTINPSLIVIDALSSELISVVIKVLAFNVPDIFTLSLI